MRRRAPRALLLWSGVELEDVPEQEQQKDEQKKEDDDVEAGEGQRFAGGFRIEEADVGGVEGLERAQQGEEQQDADAQKEHRPPSWMAVRNHGAIIGAG